MVNGAPWIAISKQGASSSLEGQVFPDARRSLSRSFHKSAHVFLPGAGRARRVSTRHAERVAGKRAPAPVRFVKMGSCLSRCRFRIFPILEVVVAATALTVQARSGRLAVVAFDLGFGLRKQSTLYSRRDHPPSGVWYGKSTHSNVFGKHQCRAPDRPAPFGHSLPQKSQEPAPLIETVAQSHSLYARISGARRARRRTSDNAETERTRSPGQVSRKSKPGSWPLVSRLGPSR